MDNNTIEHRFRLYKKAAQYPKQYFNNVVDIHTIVWYALPNEDHVTHWILALTKEMVITLIKWLILVAKDSA